MEKNLDSDPDASRMRFTGVVGVRDMDKGSGEKRDWARRRIWASFFLILNVSVLSCVVD